MLLASLLAAAWLILSVSFLVWWAVKRPFEQADLTDQPASSKKLVPMPQDASDLVVVPCACGMYELPDKFSITSDPYSLGGRRHTYNKCTPVPDRWGSTTMEEE